MQIPPEGYNKWTRRHLLLFTFFLLRIVPPFFSNKVNFTFFILQVLDLTFPKAFSASFPLYSMEINREYCTYSGMATLIYRWSFRSQMQDLMESSRFPHGPQPEEFHIIPMTSHNWYDKYIICLYHRRRHNIVYTKSS